MARRARSNQSSVEQGAAGLALIAVGLGWLAPKWLVVIGLVAGSLIVTALLVRASSSRAVGQRVPLAGSGGDGWPRAIPEPPGHVRAGRRLLSSDRVSPVRWSPELLHVLDWKLFEQLVADYFCVKGWNATVTADGADEGIDVRLATKTKPDQLFGVVQCKAWNRKRVGVSQIRELFGVMGHVNARIGIFVAVVGYTADAKAFAANKHIKLLDADDLLGLIRGLTDAQQADLLQRTTQGDYRTPSCPSCGVKFIKRVAKRGRNKGQWFWGCRHFPRCNNRMQPSAEQLATSAI